MGGESGRIVRREKYHAARLVTAFSAIGLTLEANAGGEPGLTPCHGRRTHPFHIGSSVVENAHLMASPPVVQYTQPLPLYILHPSPVLRGVE